jgi:hypothetical protein
MDQKQVKPGYKTTEFWLTLIATAAGFVLASGMMETVPEDAVAPRILGIVVSVLATLGYTITRASVKKSTNVQGETTDDA